MSYSPPPAYQPQPSQPQGEPPLSMPYYGISFGGAIRRFFTKYATFSGRASRSEFWWWTLAGAIVSLVLNILATAIGGGGMGHMNGGGNAIEIVSFVWSLAVLVPGLALTWRRLHDTDRSGLWILMGLIPFIGWIFVLVYVVGASKPSGARFDAGASYDPPAPQY